MIQLAILIPTTPDRKPTFDRLINELTRQSKGFNVEILINEDKGHKNGGKTTGTKRNELMQAAVKTGAQYVAHFDSDDMPGSNYIQCNFEGIEKGVDCCSLWGQIYWKAMKPGKPFHHSLKYDRWFEDSRYYFRTPNHLNCVKLDLVKHIPFPDQTFGEDGKWSEAVHAAKVLKTEYEINEVIYHYYAGK